MNTTYDPILESLPVKRFRAVGLRGPAIGTVLVLERAVGDPLVVHSGDRVPDARTGNYHTMHRVDVANRAIGFSFNSPSQDPVFPFIVTVSCGCQVTDPVQIVRDGVRDMAVALQAWLNGLIREVSALYDALCPAGAEAAIRKRLPAEYSPDGVRLSGFAVEVTTRDIAEIVTAQRESRVQEMRRDAMRPVARGGRDEMLAHVMALTGGDPTPLLDREQQERENSTKASLLALSALMGSDKLEEFNTSRISETVMGEFFPGAEPLLGGKRAGIRDRLDRKRKAIDSASPVIDATVSPDAKNAVGSAAPEPGKRAASSANGSPGDKPASSESAADSTPTGGGRPSRVRGVLRHEDA